MAQNEMIKLYNDKKYWNSDLRKEFFTETTGLWRDTFDNKYSGKIFNIRGGRAEKEEAESMRRIDEEMEAAIAKIGPVTQPNSHIDDFYNEIDNKKNKIVHATGHTDYTCRKEGVNEWKPIIPT